MSARHARLSDPLARLLEVKIALEREIAGPLMHVLVAHAAARIEGQRPQPMAVLETLLATHYARTVLVVTGRKPVRHPSLQDAALSFTHGERLRLRARRQASFIVAGLERDLARLNVWQGKPSGDLLTRVRDRLSGRIGAIANAETNGVAEEARFIAATIALADLNARAVSGKAADSDTIDTGTDGPSSGTALSTGWATLYKVWSTMLDAKVRPAHAAAEGQGLDGSVSAERPFVVGGEQLLFPGDTSLGASLGNVINCRCSSRYFARTATGEMVEISQTPRLEPLSPVNLGGGRGRPLMPTTSVTLNPGTRGTIVLSDLSTAKLVYRDGVATITRNGETLGWATIETDAAGRLTATFVGVTPGAEDLGISELLTRSIAVTNAWRESRDRAAD